MTSSFKINIFISPNFYDTIIFIQNIIRAKPRVEIEGEWALILGSSGNHEEVIVFKNVAVFSVALVWY